jgi:hypothetical protein
MENIIRPDIKIGFFFLLWLVHFAQDVFWLCLLFYPGISLSSNIKALQRQSFFFAQPNLISPE